MLSVLDVVLTAGANKKLKNNSKSAKETFVSKQLWELIVHWKLDRMFGFWSIFPFFKKFQKGVK